MWPSFRPMYDDDEFHSFVMWAVPLPRHTSAISGARPCACRRFRLPAPEPMVEQPCGLDHPCTLTPSAADRTPRILGGAGVRC